ncbi:MAG: MarR family transcriptional regulator [Actinomycetota bacterium]|nr:MarR family transcriptional regulator [Actinomycetota bacterium]
MRPDTRAADVAPSQRLWRLSSWLLNNAASRANRLVSRFGGPGVRIRYAALAGLDEFGPISQAELGRRLGIDRSDIVAVLNDLEHEGLALRAPDENDRRRNAIRITPAGTAALHVLDDQIDAAQDALVEPLSPDERVQLNQLLQRLLEYHAGYRSHANEVGRPPPESA